MRFSKSLPRLWQNIRHCRRSRRVGISTTEIHAVSDCHLHARPFVENGEAAALGEAAADDLRSPHARQLRVKCELI